jgi:YD repeat-containing protein
MGRYGYPAVFSVGVQANGTIARTQGQVAVDKNLRATALPFSPHFKIVPKRIDSNLAQENKAIFQPFGLFDDFDSRRLTDIGLLPDPGIAEPEPTEEPGWNASAYTYDANHPHAVSTVTNDTTSNSYQYDANGNMTTRSENGVTWTQTYNAENRLASMTAGTTTWLFSYDGDGNRVGQLITNGTSAVSTTYFVGGAYEQTTDVATTSYRKYYSIAGQTPHSLRSGMLHFAPRQ